MDQGSKVTKPETVELGGPLAGKSIVIDLDRLTIRQLEALETGRITDARKAICALIVGGDFGEDATEAVLDMHTDELGALLTAITGAFTPKKGA